MITHCRTVPSLYYEFLTKNETNIIQQPSNSPDMAPCDFFLFDRVKKLLRGTRFNSRKEVMEKSKTALMAIPTIELQKCFENWIKRINALQLMGSTLKGTISLLINKTCILNFLNEFRELFDQSSMLKYIFFSSKIILFLVSSPFLHILRSVGLVALGHLYYIDKKEYYYN